MRRLGFILALLLAPIVARAQVVILNDNVMAGRMSEIKTVVLDSLTNEPVPYASVYVIPSKDTTITNFTVTANYEEDAYRLIMGRYILFGVKWNFGKMNAVHSQRAQAAARNALF